MKVVKLLDFLNSIKIFNALEYASFDDVDLNLLDLMAEDEQFTPKIDLGLMYVKYTTLQNVIVIDGLKRIIAISLLLHAICECYKKTSKKNDNAIKYIRENYLFANEKFKLRLPKDCQIVYEKIINGERLSGKEKKSSLFLLLHSLWSQIKEKEFQAGDILKMLDKIVVTLIEVENVPIRDLYINLNKDSNSLDQYLLIEDYLANIDLTNEWAKFKQLFRANSRDMEAFFKDFFITKFNIDSKFNENIYKYFVNYFETMLQYLNKEEIINKLINYAKLYNNIINLNINDEDLKKALIKIKMHNGEDTFAYLLNIYEDYIGENITKITFLEILSTIDDYLQNRMKTPNDMSFNELIKYLNAFITCK